MASVWLGVSWPVLAWLGGSTIRLRVLRGRRGFGSAVGWMLGGDGGYPPSPLGGLLPCKAFKRKWLDGKVSLYLGAILACKRLFPLGLGAKYPP